VVAVPRQDALARRLRSLLGGRVVVDPAVTASYCTDWTGRFVGSTPAVVRPHTTDEVVAALAACRELGVPLVPQGGLTGLVGGSVPLHDEVVLSLRGLDGVGPVDVVAGQLTAAAGATVAAVGDAARRNGWEYGIDLASRASATVGGTVATNAGGTRVLRHGDTRAQLLGVEAVLGTGAVVSHLGGLLKDNTGYDLPGLLCGSEGTLAVVTAARLRLVPALDRRTTALLGFTSVDGALVAASALRRSVAALEAVELLLAPGLELVCATFGLEPPFATPSPVLLLVEAAGRGDPTADLAAAVDSLGGVVDTLVAVEPARRAALWRFREAHTEAINTLGPPHKLDVTLPSSALGGFVETVPETVRSVAPDARTWLFGHAGDGNIHVNVTGVAPGDDRVDGAVFELVAALGGSISAEHGIGAAKRRWLHLVRSDTEIDAFRALKHALDPDGILNPHALLPPAS
jgi:FAD/FMN-containing dehydrogenase